MPGTSDNMHANSGILTLTSSAKKSPLALQAHLRKGSRQEREWELGMGKAARGKEEGRST